MAANLPVLRLSLAEKLDYFEQLGKSFDDKFERFKQMIKLKPMTVKAIMPKVNQMRKTMRVISHKSSAMKQIAVIEKKPDFGALERHLDRAIVAAQLLDGILDDTLQSIA